MVQIICVLFPSIISVAILEAIMKESFNLKQTIYAFCGFCITNLMLEVFIMAFFFKNLNGTFNLMDFTNIHTFKYLLLGIFIAIVLPFIFDIFRRNIMIEIDVKRKGKNEK